MNKVSEDLDIINTTDELTKEDRKVVFEEALEAILFAAGHPISYATLARVFETTPGNVKDKVFEYSLKYNNSELPRGVILLTYGDSCQLCTKQTYLSEIRDALGIRKSGTLSTSSMEALAIVAYNQPVTRVFVDTLRRADSSYAMNNLLDRGLIECKGRLDVPGRPMLYGTTSDFLRSFGLDGIEKLPATTEEMAALFEKASNSLEEPDKGEQLEIDTDAILNHSSDDAESDIESSEQIGKQADSAEDSEVTAIEDGEPSVEDEPSVDDEPSVEDEPDY